MELDAPGRLVLDWRFSSWADGVLSRVEMRLAEPEPGNTVLTLTQTGIPEEDRFGNHDVKQQVMHAPGRGATPKVGATALRERPVSPQPACPATRNRCAAPPFFLPTRHTPQVEAGWDNQIFSRIKQIFGFGA